ncbi:MAG: DegV family protein [Clostridiaceae bacterium]|nr:DegV family protein [Clostridiaceae bacterium]
MNIRPIIALKDGKLEGVTKVRGKKKALETMMESIPDETNLISICHIHALEEVFEFLIKKIDPKHIMFKVYLFIYFRFTFIYLRLFHFKTSTVCSLLISSFI